VAGANGGAVEGVRWRRSGGAAQWRGGGVGHCTGRHQKVAAGDVLGTGSGRG
jgi:hypothetical protein